MTDKGALGARDKAIQQAWDVYNETVRQAFITKRDAIEKAFKIYKEEK